MIHLKSMEEDVTTRSVINSMYVASEPYWTNRVHVAWEQFVNLNPLATLAHLLSIWVSSSLPLTPFFLQAQLESVNLAANSYYVPESDSTSYLNFGAAVSEVNLLFGTFSGSVVHVLITSPASVCYIKADIEN